MNITDNVLRQRQNNTEIKQVWLKQQDTNRQNMPLRTEGLELLEVEVELVI